MDKLDKTVPANPEAEEAVLGSLLIDPDAVLKVASFLEDDDFYRERNGWIYRAILDLHERREPADFVTLCDELERRNILQEVGGAAYITQLINNVPSAAYVEHYGHIVERTAILRRLIDAAGQVAALAYEEAQDVDEVVDRAEQIIFNVAERRVKRDLVPVRQVMHEVVDRIEYLHRHQGQILGVPSGFTQLDRLLGGFQKSDLIILAARPAVGKCIVSGSKLLDPGTGRLVTIDGMVHRRQGHLLTLNERYKLEPTAPSDFVDDGVKPVYRVRTKLGREIQTTASHPFLTCEGWRPLAELAVGQRIAVPRALPYFGTHIIPEGRVRVLAYLLADGCLMHKMPGFTNENPLLRADFSASLADFTGVTSVTRDSNGARTPTVFAIGCDEFIERERAAFAGRLRAAVEAYPQTAGHLAAHLGVSPALVSLWQSGVCVPSADTLDRLCAELGVPADALAPHGRDILSIDDRNSVTRWLQELGLWGCNSHEKFVPDFVFELERPLVALFLNRLFACDGSIYQSKGENNPQVSYASVSLTLAREVQHLLLRFGVIAQLRHRQVSCKGERRPAYELVITGKRDVLAFLDEVGAYGKEAQTESARAALATVAPQDDTVPIEVREQILRAKGARSWREVSASLGYPVSNNFHVGKRAPGRKRFAEFARAFDDEKLLNLAESDVYWDTIESIEYVGQRQVYDLTVDRTHNFVAEDMLVHNTSLSLNFALNAARKFRKVVAYFSLEMSAEQLVQRLLSTETGIDQQRLRKGEIEDHDWDMLMAAAGELAGTMLYIDDTPAMSALELRTKARRLQAEHGLDLIVVDYLQLMRGDNRSENRVQEISYISRALKGLARELEAPVIALSQLSRAVESRTDHKPMLSDLRESGCLTGETLVTLADAGRRVPIRELTGKSGFAVWGLEESCLQFQVASVSNAFSTGIKPVFKLTTRLGRTIRATANHPFRTLFDWRRLDEIKVGERIAVPRRIAPGSFNPLSPDQAEDPRLVALAAGDVYWDEVVAVEPDGEEEVFDLTVPALSNFVANDIIVHNSIEQDSDIVMFIYREDLHKENSDKKNIADIIVAKHRNGPTDTIPLYFRKELTKFENLEMVREPLNE